MAKQKITRVKISFKKKKQVEKPEIISGKIVKTASKSKNGSKKFINLKK